MTKRFFQQKLLCRENENNVVKGMIIHVKIRESPKGDTSVASSSSILFNFEREINGLLRDSTHVGYSDLSFETGGSESVMKSSPGMGVPTFIGRAKMRVDVMCRLVDRTVVFFNDRPVWSDKILAAFICNRAVLIFD